MVTCYFNPDTYEEDWATFYKEHSANTDLFLGQVLLLLEDGVSIVNELVSDTLYKLDPGSVEDISIASNIIHAYTTLHVGNIIEEMLEDPTKIPSHDHVDYNAWRFLSHLNLV